MISLHQVRKQFGSRYAVDRLDLEVKRGEIFGLLGHNGAGKSTTIGMMLGQVWPTAGAIHICDHDIATHRHLALKKVGAIFEAPAFYDYLSGWRNLEILSHYTARTPASRIREVIDWVGLTGREKSAVRTYSHGMKARLALAQALLPRPELLILDEPSDGLDPEGIHEMRQTILRLHQDFGLTILLSSHLLNEVEQLCTRIAVLNQGKRCSTALSPKPPNSSIGFACAPATSLPPSPPSAPPDSSAPTAMAASSPCLMASPPIKSCASSSRRPCPCTRSRRRIRPWRNFTSPS